MPACMEHRAVRSDRLWPMNETDFIRQQLAAERAHLREVLEAVRRGTTATANARPVALYIDWASRRLVQQLAAHRTALEMLASPPAGEQLAQVAAAVGKVSASPAERPSAAQAEGLLAVLEAWTEPLDILAAQRLRIGHWRQAARLSADSILEERQLYAAARSAVGLA
jgi:hypothetical protein